LNGLKKAARNPGLTLNQQIDKEREMKRHFWVAIIFITILVTTPALSGHA
jgi:hypothetical protein